MEEIDFLKNMLKSVIGNDIDFEITTIDKDGKTTDFKGTTKKKECNCEKNNMRNCSCNTDQEGTIELQAAYNAQKKYIEQLTEKLDYYNKKEIERAKHIEDSKGTYKHLMRDFEQNLVILNNLYLDLCEELGFENEPFYENFENDILNYNNQNC